MQANHNRLRRLNMFVDRHLEIRPVTSVLTCSSGGRESLERASLEFQTVVRWI